MFSLYEAMRTNDVSVMQFTRNAVFVKDEVSIRSLFADKFPREELCTSQISEEIHLREAACRYEFA